MECTAREEHSAKWQGHGMDARGAVGQRQSSVMLCKGKATPSGAKERLCEVQHWKRKASMGKGIELIGAGHERKNMTDFYDNSDVPENAIEWLKGKKTATVTLAGRTTLNTRIRKLAESHPGKCSIRDENEDGTIVAHIPVSWIKFYPERELSEEERERLSAFGKQNVAKARAVAQRKRAETRPKGKK